MTKFRFSYEYVGGGFFRKRGVPGGTTADMLHGDHAITAAILEYRDAVKAAAEERRKEQEELLCANCSHDYYSHSYGARGCDYQAHGNALECTCVEWEPFTPKPNVMAMIDGKSFRCHCLCNVFTKIATNIYKCNACDSRFKGEA
jgi:hypothetical protein